MVAIPQDNKSTIVRTYNTQAHRAPAFARAAVSVAAALSSDLAGRVAFRLFTTPRRHPLPGLAPSLRTSARPIDVEVDGRRVAAWSWGGGPAVLFVHGWEGRGAQFAPFVEPLVAAGLRPVIFDAPAHGDSEGSTLNLVQQVGVVLAVARAVAPIHAIVAHSFGAAAATVAMGRGLAADRVVLLAPMTDVDAAIRRFSTALGLSPPAHEAFRRTIERRTRTPIERMLPRAIAPGLSAELTVIHDRQDREVPLDDGVTIAAAWPGAAFVTTDGLGHRRLLRDPSVIDRTVAILSRGVPAPARDATLTPIEELERSLFDREERWRWGL